MQRLLIILIAALPLSLSAQVWTLDSCVQYAYLQNLSIKQSKLNVELAEASELNALGNMLPSLNGQATHGFNWGQRIDPFTNQFATERIRSNNFGINTSMTLFNGFALLNSWKQSELNTEASKWNYEKMQNDIALNVSSSYLAVLLNREMLIIAQQNLAATQKQLTRIEKLVFAGQLAENVLADMEAQEASDKASLINAENSHTLSKLALMQLLQLDALQMETFEIFVPDMSDFSTEVMIASPQLAAQAALNNFPEVKSATTQLAAADLGVKAAKGSRYPSLNMSYSYGSGYSGAAKEITGEPTLVYDTLEVEQVEVVIPGLNYDDDDYTLKPFEKQFKDNINQSLFFSLTIPIFNGFATRTNVKRAELNREITALQLEQTKQALEQSVYRAHADVQAALASYQASEESVKASQRAFQYAETRYENGQTNLVDYNDARTRLDNALASQARARYDFIFKLKVLEFYQGKSISMK
ncbi:MAG: TolC family protein [Flavobacteriales bacterium]